MDDENPYAAPQAELDESDFVLEGDPSIVRRGRKLIVPKGALLPTRCVKCNVPAHQTLQVKIHQPFTNPAIAACILTIMLAVPALLILTFGDFSLLWMIPIVGTGILITMYLQRDAPRPTKTTFYVCSKHQLSSRLFNALWIMLMLGLFIGPRLIDRLDFNMPDYHNFQYLILLVVIASFSSGLTVRVLGTRISSNCEFQGFGKKYLESFPESDDT